MVGELEWFSRERHYGWIKGTDNIGQVCRYFLPESQIRFLKVEPVSHCWVQFMPAPAAYGLRGGHAASPIARFAGIYPSRAQAEAADKLVSIGAARKDWAAASSEAGHV